ncbi:MAG TPA: hypothetical protein VNV43_09720 [Candidatus Acidoferrales bacterium]|jgi:hypothetical protein|nr:hypothetical protein [Candidatus Acidoferrales bacterium]
MRDETDIERLERQIAMAREMVRQTAIKVEELEASVEEIYSFKERIVMFPRHGKGQLPTRVDKSEDAGEFLLT